MLKTVLYQFYNFFLGGGVDHTAEHPKIVLYYHAYHACMHIILCLNGLQMEDLDIYAYYIMYG